MSESYDSGSRIPGRKQTHGTSADASSTALDITDTGVHSGPNEDQRVKLWDVLISTDTDMRLTFRDEDGNNTFHRMYVAANTPVQLTPRAGLVCPVNGLGVEILASAAGNLDVTAIYSYVSDKEA